MRKLLTALLVAACVPLFAACGQRVEVIGSQTFPVAPHTVVITNKSFIPHKIVITAGQTVTWKWNDGITPHDVTFTGYGLSAASPIQVRGTWTHTFDTPGTYYYRCSIHDNMNGIVEVRPSG